MQRIMLRLMRGTAPRETGDTGAVLRRPDFRWLLAGTTLSNGAQWIQQVTLSWLIYDLTGSGALLGTLNLVRSLATLGLAPVAGVAIDRLPRRTLMLAVTSWLLVISLVLGLALLAGYTALWPFFLFTFLGGVAQAIDLPLRQTVVFVLVPRTGAECRRTGPDRLGRHALAGTCPGWLPDPLDRPWRELSRAG